MALRDQRLVCAAQLGCRKAFDELASLYSRRVHWTTLDITKNPEDAEDAMGGYFSPGVCSHRPLRGQSELLFVADANREQLCVHGFAEAPQS
jgi:hypothetical protein